MGLQLPHELAALLHEMGYRWPESDEQKMYELGQAWLEFAETTRQTATDVTQAVAGLPEGNSGAGMDSFWAQWHKDDAVAASLKKAATGGQLIGGALFVCAAVILYLKIQVIIQLIELAIQIAQAIAAAPATWGASLAQIPIFKQLKQVLINILIDEAVEAIVGG